MLPDAWPQPDLLDVLPLQAATSPETECFGVWVMIERNSRSVVGDIGFMGPPDEAGAIEVGYSVIPERRRRGYATEAARAAIGYGFDELGLREIVALTVPANQRSRRVMERLGMTRLPEDDFDHPGVPEGPLKRCVLYRLRKPEGRAADLSGRRG